MVWSTRCSLNINVVEPSSILCLNHLCLRFLKISSCLLQVEVALFVCAAGAKASTGESRPGSALEQQDGEDDAESEAEG